MWYSLVLESLPPVPSPGVGLSRVCDMFVGSREANGETVSQDWPVLIFGEDLKEMSNLNMPPFASEIFRYQATVAVFRRGLTTK